MNYTPTIQELTIAHIAKERPDWPAHSICKMVRMDSTDYIMTDPRIKCCDKADMITRMFDEIAPAL
jgi:hypothetical protein